MQNSSADMGPMKSHAPAIVACKGEIAHLRIGIGRGADETNETVSIQPEAALAVETVTQPFTLRQILFLHAQDLPAFRSCAAKGISSGA